MHFHKRAVVATATCMALIGSGVIALTGAATATAAPQALSIGKVTQSCSGTLMKDKAGKPYQIKYGDLKKNGIDESIGRLDIWVNDSDGTICAKNWRINQAANVSGLTSVELSVKGMPKSGDTYAKDAKAYTRYAGAATVKASAEVTVRASLQFKDPKKKGAKLRTASTTAKFTKLTPTLTESKEQVQKILTTYTTKTGLDWYHLAECLSGFDVKKQGVGNASTIPRFGLFQISKEEWQKAGYKGAPSDVATIKQVAVAQQLFQRHVANHITEANALRLAADELWGDFTNANKDKCSTKIIPLAK